MSNPSWHDVLERIVSKPAPIPAEAQELRIALLTAGSLAPADLDNALARAWRAADPLVRRESLRDACEGLELGVGFIEALIGSITDDKHTSANAAITVLNDAANLDLTDHHWRRIAAVARRQRDDLLPDIEAAQLVAAHRPRGSFATIALSAFRHGPEDAEDRGMSIAALGYFDDPRVAGWLAPVASSGVLGLEVLHAASEWFARNRKSASDAERTAWMDIVEAAAGAGPRSAIAILDAWQRWGALEIASAMRGPGALPLVVGAWQAGAHDAEHWFMPGVEQRLTELCSNQRAAAAGPEAVVQWFLENGATPTPMAAIPPIRERLDARCPRISRRAAVLLEQAGGHAEALKAAQSARAAVEKALVARKQLMGSLLVGFDVEAADLGDEWRPVADAMSEEERSELQRVEDAWLADI